LVAETIKQPIKQLMAIPVVIQGTVEVEGKVFELDSPKGGAWLETIGSFRFEPSGDGKPCTIRREPSGYWYGCRKVAGKVCKKYIGKTSELSTARLEKIAEALDVPPEARVSKVAEVAQKVTQQVAQNAEAAEVAEVAQDRLTALELEVASLRKALEDLQEALPGKLESGDSLELPKVDDKVTEGLQNELGNLKAENEALKTDIETLRRSLAKSDTLINLRNQEIAALTCRLAAKDETIAETGEQFDRLDQEVTQLRSQLDQERADREEAERELSDLKQKSVTSGKSLLAAAELLNQLKTRRKKSSASLADVELILEMIEES
jgi:chromosome segregation ATPase